MSYLHTPVIYLQDKDIDQNGNVANPKLPTHLPMVVMVQASWCGHCVSAKPDFQKFADETDGKVTCCTVQKDGKEPGESDLGDRVGEFDDEFKGFPHYMLYRGGKRVKGQLTGRDVASLHKFVT